MNRASDEVFYTMWKYLSDYWVTRRSELIDFDKVEYSQLLFYKGRCEVPEEVINAEHRSEAVTLIEYHYNTDGIVIGISSKTYVAFTNILRVSVDFNMDIDKIVEYYKMILTHELGHIVFSTNNEIGKTINDVRLANNIVRNPTGIRRNASMKERLNWYIQHMNLPEEKEANDSVGLSMDEIIFEERNRLMASQECIKTHFRREK